LRAGVASFLISTPKRWPVTSNAFIVAIKIRSSGWAGALFVDCNESRRTSYTRFRGFVPP
jgi:hypothetical protein